MNSAISISYQADRMVPIRAMFFACFISAAMTTGTTVLGEAIVEIVTPGAALLSSADFRDTGVAAAAHERHNANISTSRIMRRQSASANVDSSKVGRATVRVHGADHLEAMNASRSHHIEGTAGTAALIEAMNASRSQHIEGTAGTAALIEIEEGQNLTEIPAVHKAAGDEKYSIGVGYCEPLTWVSTETTMTRDACNSKIKASKNCGEKRYRVMDSDRKCGCLSQKAKHECKPGSETWKDNKKYTTFTADGKTPSGGGGDGSHRRRFRITTTTTTTTTATTNLLDKLGIPKGSGLMLRPALCTSAILLGVLLLQSMLQN